MKKIDKNASLFGKPETDAPHSSDSPLRSREDAVSRQRPEESAAVNIRFTPRQPRYSLADLTLETRTRDEVGILLSRVKNNQLIFDEWGFSRVHRAGSNLSFNLYGPPGTGKTTCAEAIAHELGKNIIEIGYAELESKYVGETAKNIVRAFEAASSSESVVFFDEADSILGRRITSVSSSADQAVNVSRAVMLKELDRFSGLCLFATNLSGNFDKAFVRRIAQSVEIPLPSLATRSELWRNMFPKAAPHRPIDFDKLAAESNDMSGGDIKNAILYALSRLAARDHRNQPLNTLDLFQAITEIKNSKAVYARNESPI